MLFPLRFPGLRHDISFPIFDFVISGVAQAQIHTWCMHTDPCTCYTLMHKKHTPTTSATVSRVLTASTLADASLVLDVASVFSLLCYCSREHILFTTVEIALVPSRDRTCSLVLERSRRSLLCHSGIYCFDISLHFNSSSRRRRRDPNLSGLQRGPPLCIWCSDELNRGT